MVDLISQNMRILRDEYSFDTVAARKACLSLSDQVPGNLMLDVGTGSGWMALVAAQAGKKVWSMDVDAGAVRRAHSRVAQMPLSVQDRIQFLIADGSRLPFPDRLFPAVLSFDVLHHFSEGSCTRVIQEMLRVCARGGAVILSDLNDKGMQAVEEVIARTGEFHDHNHCNLRTLAPLLDSIGVRFRRMPMDFVTAFVIERPLEYIPATAASSCPAWNAGGVRIYQG
jgi:ubiquinone/menaquinone biosynthesis C-methylase UbiE